MAAPEYVPGPVAEQPRVYQSPPRRPDSWTNNRPGDFNGPQPEGPGLGSQGPDQGYAMKLARQFEGQLALAAGEHEADAIAGCLQVAMKRASIFGRAPMVHDLTVGFAVWGYLGEGDDALIAARRPLFEECSRPHHYMERRIIADAVPEAVLRLTPAQVRLEVANNWRSLIRLPGEAAPHVPAPMPVAEVPAPAPVVEPAIVEDVPVEPVAVVADAPVAHDAPPPVAEPAPAPEPPPPPAPVAPSAPAPAPPAPVAEREPEPAPAPPPVAAEPLPTRAAEPPAEPAPVAPAAKTGSDAQTDEEAEPEVAAPPPELPPELRKPVKPVPVNPEEIAKLARQAKVAFQKQSHQKPKEPPAGS